MRLVEYLELPEVRSEEISYELDEGELVPISPTAKRHGKRLDRVYRYLIQHLPEEQYDILAGGVGFILQGDPAPTVRGADLAVQFREDDIPEGFAQEPPLLAIELVSPSHTAEDLDRKRTQYLAAGAREVWILYETTKTLHVFQSENRALVYGLMDTFESSLGFAVVVSELFR